MRMQEICKISGFTKRNIHYYIKEGLLSPASDVQNGYYDFSEEEVKRLSLIRLFRNAGLSISVIRSIMNTPDSTGLYLNQHIKELHKEKERLEGILSAMNDLFERLPVNTDIDKLYALGTQIHIPEICSYPESDSFDANDKLQVNRILWVHFLPEPPLTEYQEFLWQKLNHLTNIQYNENCRKIRQFLHTLDITDIDRLFKKKDKHINYVASLDHDGCLQYAEEMKNRIRAFMKNKENIDAWKRYYSLYIYPEIQIYDSEICSIMLEISPLFVDYCTNIHLTCERVYVWLQQTLEGKALEKQLLDLFDDKIDLIHSQNGELELLANFPQLILGADL